MKINEDIDVEFSLEDLKAWVDDQLHQAGLKRKGGLVLQDGAVTCKAERGPAERGRTWTGAKKDEPNGVPF